jgi:hypothetical protein
VAFKASERAKEMSVKNKANADKKEHHHVLGQTATRVQCLGGKLWRMNRGIKESL